MKKNLLLLFLLVCVACAQESYSVRSRIGASGTVGAPDGVRTRFKNQSDAQDVDVDDDLEEDEIDIATVEEEIPGGVEPSLHIEDEGQGMTSDDGFDVAAKRKDVIALVEKGVDFLQKNDASEVFLAFTQTKKFIKGELYLFVIDEQGVCLAHGRQRELIWKNLIDLHDVYGAPFIKSMLDKAKQGAGWVTYAWNNATKVSYVTEVKKGDKRYVIGCGYYPHSKEDAVVNLVKGAVALFNSTIAAGRPKEEVFSSLSYPGGRFVIGDLYLFALDFKGVLMAQGDRPGLIGTNAWDIKDATGKFPNQEIIQKLKERPNEGVWTTYVSKRAVKKTYSERVVDSKGNNYFIACGYYPKANRDAATDLVKLGYRYMKSSGKNLAAQDFMDKRNDTFRYGDLYLIVYDTKGTVIAHGGNTELVGTNQEKIQDEDGRYYVQEIIEKAKEGGGWLDYKINNSFKSTYIELVDLGTDSYVITCGVFPVTKSETANLLLKSGMSVLRTKSTEDAFAQFTTVNGSFIRGDLELLVVDATGLCYAAGVDYSLIWQQLLNAKDDDGKTYIKTMINTIKQGPGKITYKINGVFKVAFVDSLQKGDKTYIVSSSYYQ